MVTAILLAGGLGTRMGASVPKQFLPLRDKPIALYSYELLARSPLISEILVVCSPIYHPLFPSSTLFAMPGPRRQDSVYSGLQKATQKIVLIHDAARPLLEEKYLSPLLEATERTGAAALAVPVTSTIKQTAPDRLVKKTLDRSTLWEIQTPQAIQRDLLLQAFHHAETRHLTVTDDLSLIEAMGHPTELVPSSPRNLKITTPFDLALAEVLCVTN